MSISWLELLNYSWRSHNILVKLRHTVLTLHYLQPQTIYTGSGTELSDNRRFLFGQIKTSHYRGHNMKVNLL